MSAVQAEIQENVYARNKAFAAKDEDNEYQAAIRMTIRILQ